MMLRHQLKEFALLNQNSLIINRIKKFIQCVDYLVILQIIHTKRLYIVSDFYRFIQLNHLLNIECIFIINYIIYYLFTIYNSIGTEK